MDFTDYEIIESYNWYPLWMAEIEKLTDEILQKTIEKYSHIIPFPQNIFLEEVDTKLCLYRQLLTKELLGYYLILKHKKTNKIIEVHTKLKNEKQ